MSGVMDIINGVPKYPWRNVPRPVILSDGSYGTGQGVLEAAKRLGLGTGGFTCMVKDITDLRDYGVIAGGQFKECLQANVQESDAVVILTRDPRSMLMDDFIRVSKERHKPLRIILSMTNVEGAVQWLKERKFPKHPRLFITGSAHSKPEAGGVTAELLEGWLRP